MKPKYQQVKDYIIEKIHKGELSVGDKLMSETELIDALDVSRHTVRKALNDLANERVIETFKGKGSYVAETKTFNDTDGMEKPKVVAVITAFINDTIFPPLMSGIENVLAEEDYAMMLFSTRNKIDTERDILVKISQHNLAGVIVEPTKSALPNPNTVFYKKLKEKGIPTIFIHAYYDKEDNDYVIVDDVKAAYKACQHLIDNGHSKIGGVFKSDDLQGHKRYEGFVQCMFDNGFHINEDYIMWQATEDEHAIYKNKRLLRDYVKRLKTCTGLVCYNDEFAIELIDEIHNEKLDVPENLSVVGFDNTKLGDNYKVAITSVDHPKKKLGELAGRRLLDKIHNENTIVKEIMEVDLVEKQSVKKIVK